MRALSAIEEVSLLALFGFVARGVRDWIGDFGRFAVFARVEGMPGCDEGCESGGAEDIAAGNEQVSTRAETEFGGERRGRRWRYYPYSLGTFNATDMVGDWSAGELCYKVTNWRIDNLLGEDEEGNDLYTVTASLGGRGLGGNHAGSRLGAFGVRYVRKGQHGSKIKTSLLPSLETDCTVHESDRRGSKRQTMLARLINTSVRHCPLRCR